MILFSISLKPFLRICKFSLKGLKVNKLYKASAYADDITIFFENKNDIETIKKLLKIYCGASNAEVNFEKSCILLLGKIALSSNNKIQNFHIKMEIKILGMLCSTNFSSMIKSNWNRVIKNISISLNFVRRMCCLRPVI